MAFIATNLIPARGYDTSKKESIKLKATSIRISNFLDTDATGDQLIEIVAKLQSHRDILANIIIIPGLGDYARNQENDQAYDVVAELQNTFDKLDASIVLVHGYSTNALIASWGPYGVIWATFTPAQTSALKASVDEIIASII